jgi:ferredoxin
VERLRDELTLARLAVNDYYAARSNEDLDEWRRAQQRLIDAATALALSTTASPAPASPCQHTLKRESQKCGHGYYMGSTCDKCILACPQCWDHYSSSASYGPRPASPPGERPDQQEDLMDNAKLKTEINVVKSELQVHVQRLEELRLLTNGQDGRLASLAITDIQSAQNWLGRLADGITY